MGNTASVGNVNNGLTNTNPVYTVKVGRISQTVQTDPWQLAVDELDKDLKNLAIGGLHHGGSYNKKPAQPEDVWLQVCETLDVPKGNKFQEDSLIQKRSGWKTIRIFVSSTFRDFHEEREILVKEVFPDLRHWCETRRLHLVECDLRWGIPKDTTTEATLRTCLGEIDRCYQDNVMPYFLNMTSERIGWIPLPAEVPPGLVDEYRWVFGLSVTEMEIVHGAYRKDNPNSLFFIRDDSFLEQMPAEYKTTFIDENPIAPVKLKILREMIADRFPKSRVIKYTCSFDGYDKNTQRVRLKLDPVFKEKIFEFFKDRIKAQYPVVERDLDPLEISRELHESFMKSKSETVLGRDAIIKQLVNYICGPDPDVPLLVLGGPGSGKSSIMAKVADDTVARAQRHELPHGGSDGWSVFYHFVGAVPGSIELLLLLQRLLLTMGLQRNELPTKLEDSVQMVCSSLNKTETKPIIIFIDALNQLDDDQEALLMNWVPRKLAPRIRCIFSLIPDTPQHKSLINRESTPQEVHVKPLTLAVRKDIVNALLGKYTKKLDMDQMIDLLSKKSSENPLWLSIACEELRVFGQFRSISDKINSLADSLPQLFEQVFERFEWEMEDTGSHILRATLCLLEVSSHGLLETELLEILADEDNLVMPKDGEEKGEKEQSEKERGFKPCGQLPAAKWARVFRSLRPFLRPFGDSGEGRLDFYHRSLSKAVRKKYLKSDGSEEINEQYRWWHRKLADYYEYSLLYDRKVEEYPYHLTVLKDADRMESFLSDWQVFERLYNKEHSGKMLKYWELCGGHQRMLECYSIKLQELKEEGDNEILAKRYEQISSVLVQAGEYDQAMDICKEGLKLEEEILGNRDHRKVEFYCILALIMDQKIKMHGWSSRSQIPEIRQCLLFMQQAIAILRLLKDQSQYFKRTLGQYLVKQAFVLGSLVDCGGDAQYPPTVARQQGVQLLDEAIEILEQVHDIGCKADAVMTKAVLHRYDNSYQLKHYKEAEELCRQAYGDLHFLMGRIMLNTGIVYEDSGNYEKSYEYFRRNYEILLEVFGPNHIRTCKARDIVSEPMYKRIAQQRGVPVPGEEPVVAASHDDEQEEGVPSSDDEQRSNDLI